MQFHDSRRAIFIQWNLQGRPSLCTNLVSIKNYSSATARAGRSSWEIGSERIQKIIDEMVKVMRNAPGVGLAAPQIGIPLKIIVLEDTNEYISYAPKDETKAQDRRPFDLLVIINPKLKKKGSKTALFFEGCLSVDGFRAVVERHLEVEVGGLDRNGKTIKVDASGWQARILQHECDHLDGTLYVDKMAPRTFRTVENLDLPLAAGCPKLGVC
ncbi:hypothetical protein RND71_012990 [Anisodus tanguticus]|uniref:Peptide deformylase n=1 Tax=Anisodus tanguticus TaxID=243964 RepID=A0AAE1SH04_9SOLA|nr:hypothetical protein RND71_012990 [Anisodus tanguticus]